MLPAIALALSVEKLRDGGSLCAAFQGVNGAQYWLVLPVVLDGDEPRGYSAPILVERPFAPEEVQVSWEHAALLLDQVERLLPVGKSRSWIDPMYKAIQNRGVYKVS